MHSVMLRFALILLTTSCFTFFMVGSQQVAAQCTNSAALNVSLGSGETASTSIFLFGELTSFTVNLDFTGNESSWPSDILISVFRPDGNCVGWGGYSYGVTNGCNDLGSGNGMTWPEIWKSTSSGSYSCTLDASGWGLNGSGYWTVEIENAYTTTSTELTEPTYDIEFVFAGPSCEGDCPDPGACNYVIPEEQTHPLVAACSYADYLFGVEYDCDGNCLDDEDGDGICDPNDDCFGVIDECGVCAGTGYLACTDVLACNFDAGASCDDGSCEYVDECGDCGGSGYQGGSCNPTVTFNLNMEYETVSIGGVYLGGGIIGGPTEHQLSDPRRRRFQRVH